MGTAVRSKRILLYDPTKIELINEETKKYLKKYRMDMELRELSTR